eukprot:CAMPEP_0170345322 /NCGR_PEP_ID=MMETSP0116_2-20130129/73886_1 /TAXON_ID=400756 /ORGANISM="Durinskia baltica, Strain CSIRO CS-38" /LENGTH=76 /DNA_ID=CAMNT_0010599075 /DNA_START=32 /DNA_END=259 /DNA_ORIENTATION=+
MANNSDTTCRSQVLQQLETSAEGFDGTAEVVLGIVFVPRRIAGLLNFASAPRAWGGSQRALGVPFEVPQRMHERAT